MKDDKPLKELFDLKDTTIQRELFMVLKPCVKVNVCNAKNVYKVLTEETTLQDLKETLTAEDLLGDVDPQEIKHVVEHNIMFTFEKQLINDDALLKKIVKQEIAG